MNNKYPFFKYVVGTSSIHLMNSKQKILWSLLTLLSIFIMNDYISAFIILLFLLFVIYKSRIGIDAYVNNLILLFPIYIIIFLISFLITIDLLFSFLILIKVMFVVLILLILTFTTSLSEIAWGFECLFNGLKKFHIPVSKISLKISLGIKFISTLFEQFKTIRKSMAYRGIPYNSGNIIKSFKLMFMPAIRLSYKLSTRMVASMKLRFYGNCKRRTNYHENKVTKLGKGLIICDFILIYIIIWLGWLR